MISWLQLHKSGGEGNEKGRNDIKGNGFWTTPPGWRPFSSVLLYPLVEEKHKGFTSFT